ncbi:putative membrane protein [Yersinia pestis]|nr:putative membrane protein [Yersinia pestis]
MKGQKNLHCLLAGILLSISSGSFAQPAAVVSSLGLPYLSR